MISFFRVWTPRPPTTRILKCAYPSISCHLCPFRRQTQRGTGTISEKDTDSQQENPTEHPTKTVPEPNSEAPPTPVITRLQRVQRSLLSALDSLRTKAGNHCGLQRPRP